MMDSDQANSRQADTSGQTRAAFEIIAGCFISSIAQVPNFCQYTLLAAVNARFMVACAAALERRHNVLLPRDSLRIIVMPRPIVS